MRRTWAAERMGYTGRQAAPRGKRRRVRRCLCVRDGRSGVDQDRVLGRGGAVARCGCNTSDHGNASDRHGREYEARLQRDLLLPLEWVPRERPCAPGCSTLTGRGRESSCAQSAFVRCRSCQRSRQWPRTCCGTNVGVAGAPAGGCSSGDRFVTLAAWRSSGQARAHDRSERLQTWRSHTHELGPLDGERRSPPDAARARAHVSRVVADRRQGSRRGSQSDVSCPKSSAARTGRTSLWEPRSRPPVWPRWCSGSRTTGSCRPRCGKTGNRRPLMVSCWLSRRSG